MQCRALALKTRHARRAIGSCAEQGCVSVHRTGRRAQLGTRRGWRPQPALRSLPLDELRMGQRQHRRGLRHREAPQTQLGRGRGEERQTLVAAGVPVGPSLRVVHAGTASFAGHAFAGRFHRGHRATQAHKQELGCVWLGVVLHPTRGVDRQRLAAPAVQLLQGFVLSEREHQRGFGQGHGQHLQTHLADQAQGAHRPRHDATHVVTRHVLHDLTAEGEQLAAAVDEACAQHVVAHRTDAGPRRTGQARGHHAPHGAARAKTGWFERKTLALPGQQRLHLGQGSARAHGDHELGGLITDDAGPVGGGKHIALGGRAVKRFRVAADNAQWPAGSGGFFDLVDQMAGFFDGAGLHPIDGSRRSPARL
ncbi:hypothetical protein FQZ97_745520 [compost metagenome]